MTSQQQQVRQGSEASTSVLELPGIQEFGSNQARIEEVGAESGSSSEQAKGAVPEGASTFQLIQHVHRAMSFVALRQREGLKQFERDAVLQDPPPYVNGEVQALATLYMTIGFDLIGKLGVSDPIVGFVLEQVISAAKDYALSFVPDLADPQEGKITADHVEDLVDQTCATLDGCWNMASAEFINQQSGLDDAALRQLADQLDKIGPTAADAQYGACLGSWVSYCGSVAADEEGGFDPSFLAHLTIHADNIPPRSPVPASLRSLPAVGEELQKEMARYSASSAHIRLRITDPMGIDFTVEPTGLLMEDNSTGMGRHYLYLVGIGRPDLWRPGEPPRAPTSDPNYDGHVVNGAQILALQHVHTPFSQFGTGG